MNPSQSTTENVEESVRSFYDNTGWVSDQGKSGEDRFFRQFRKAYYPYHERTIERTIACFSGIQGHLLLAGGGDLPDSHVRLARRFSEVTCLDISAKALEIAEGKLQKASKYSLGSILDIPFPDTCFDAVLCAHVIYHIHIDAQARAVSELIRVTKKGGRVVIIYSNPRSLIKRIEGIVKKAGRLAERLRLSHPDAPQNKPPQPNLYFDLHPLAWWNQFSEKGKVTVLPWDVMGNGQEKGLLQSDAIASAVYGICSRIEKLMPGCAARWWHYTMIVIDKS